MQILRQHLFTAALLAAALLANPATAAIYMKFGTIQGDVTAPGFEDRIRLDSVQWGQSRLIEFQAGSGVAIGKLNSSEVALSKSTDRASSGLAAAILSNKPEGVLISIVNNSDGEILRLELCDALVTSTSTSAGAEGKPSEAISLSFTAYRLTHFDPDLKTGGAGVPVRWDFALNKEGSCSVSPS